MSKYEELKYVLSGATDWGYEYAKKEDVEAAFAELEERHAMELDQWVLELEKTKLENERLKKLLFNAQKAASDAKLSAHEKSRRIDELKAENESLKYSVATLETDLAMMKRWRKVSEELPKEGSLVIVADFRGSFPYYELATLLKTTSGSFVWNINSSDDCDILDVFTHWRPLPPREEK